MKKLLVGDILNDIIGDLGIRSILKVGIIVAWSVDYDHIIELFTLNMLGHSRWTLFRFKNAVTNFSIIPFFQVVHNEVCRSGFSISNLSKYEHDWLPILNSFKTDWFSQCLDLLENFGKFVQIVVVL